MEEKLSTRMRVKELLRKRIPFRMSRLFDRWSLSGFFLLFYIKILQMLKWLGIRNTESGWRAASGTFLKGENSKFILGTFCISYADRSVHSEQEARQVLLNRLGKFLRERENLYWSVTKKYLRLKRRRTNFLDVMETEFLPNGVLRRIHPYFDPSDDLFANLSQEEIERISTLFSYGYNSVRNEPDKTRGIKLYRLLRNTPVCLIGSGIPDRQAWKRILYRMMAAACVTIEVLPESSAPDFLKLRLSTPAFQHHRHPGWGLLNIAVRITADWKEADLWFQYHHVPVDGMPMQENLTLLKEQWGTLGEIQFPKEGTPEAKPEVRYCGNGLFRARCFLSFQKMLRLRTFLNKKYANQMRGPASVAGMIFWGLAQNEPFRDVKMLFPIDLSESGRLDPKERDLSLLFIRPSEYNDPAGKLESFLKFQLEFNRKLERTKAGNSESAEIVSLCAMIPPFVLQSAKHLMPQAFQEIVGNMGMSILRHAEIFISPSSALQTHGFVAIGNMNIPRVGGGRACAVSLCGTRKQVSDLGFAMMNIADHYADLLELSEDNIEEVL